MGLTENCFTKLASQLLLTPDHNLFTITSNITPQHLTATYLRLLTIVCLQLQQLGSIEPLDQQPSPLPHSESLSSRHTYWKLVELLPKSNRLAVFTSNLTWKFSTKNVQNYVQYNNTTKLSNDEVSVETAGLSIHDTKSWCGHRVLLQSFI